MRITMQLILLLNLLMFFCFSTSSYAEENPFTTLKDETLSYFKPMEGEIIKIDNKKVLVNLGLKDLVKKGMKFNIFLEEAPFKHPVTKEPIGFAELLKGKIEIKEVNADFSIGEIIEGEAREGYKIRISGTKVNLLFCQSPDTDWYLAETLYRALKESGRFNMIDTDLETDDEAKVIEEGKRLNAEVVLLLTANIAESGTYLKERLFWVADGVKFFEKEVKVEDTIIKELRFGEDLFASHKEEALLKIDLPMDVKHLITGDIDGDKNVELIAGSEKEIKFYKSEPEILPAMGDLKIKTSVDETYIWLDSIDLNKNGRDEIILTSLEDNKVVSYIYEFENDGFSLLYKGEVFMRRLANAVIAQAYSPSEGYHGKVFYIEFDGKKYKKGEDLTLPSGINIYDFVYLEDPKMGELTLAYDDESLSLYDDKGIKIWRSQTSTGGFIKTFKRHSPTVMVDRGEWSVKDRLFVLGNSNVLFVKRIPLLEMVKGLGFKSSQIRKLVWNGLSMEESVLIDDIKGTILDYTMAGDKLFVLTKPLFGIKARNILKGGNPLGTILNIYLIRG